MCAGVVVAPRLDGPVKLTLNLSFPRTFCFVVAIAGRYTRSGQTGGGLAPGGGGRRFHSPPGSLLCGCRRNGGLRRRDWGLLHRDRRSARALLLVWCGCFFPRLLFNRPPSICGVPLTRPLPAVVCRARFRSHVEGFAPNAGRSHRGALPTSGPGWRWHKL